MGAGMSLGAGTAELTTGSNCSGKQRQGVI